MNVQEASRILKLIFPVDAETFKKQYRKRALETHSDHNGGDDTEFKKLTEAYAYIKDHAPEMISASADGRLSKVTHTIDGTPLCELGLGLGPTTNGRPCDECRGAGHVPCRSEQVVVCTACDNGWIDLHATWPKVYPYGKFRKCFCCHGLGHKIRATKTGDRLFCVTCGGTGEIKLYNPVLPKGALAALAGKFNG